MSYKLLLVCDRCGDSKVFDNPDTPQRVYVDSRGKRRALCDRCNEKLAELNDSINKYKTIQMDEFFRGVNA